MLVNKFINGLLKFVTFSKQLVSELFSPIVPHPPLPAPLLGRDGLVAVEPEAHAGEAAHGLLNLGEVQVDAAGGALPGARPGAVRAERLRALLALRPALVQQGAVHVDHVAGHVVVDDEGLVLELGEALDPLEHGGGVAGLAGGAEGVWAGHCQERLEVQGAGDGDARHREAGEGLGFPEQY